MHVYFSIFECESEKILEPRRGVFPVNRGRIYLVAYVSPSTSPKFRARTMDPIQTEAIDAH